MTLDEYGPIMVSPNSISDLMVNFDNEHLSRLPQISEPEKQMDAIRKGISEFVSVLNYFMANDSVFVEACCKDFCERVGYEYIPVGESVLV